MTKIPRLFGADYSVYVRIVRLCLVEKGVDHDLVPIDIFADGAVPAHYVSRHPFRRIPAFEHEDFTLYEIGAITRYVDEAFDGPALQPRDLHRRARCNQMISIADNYVYPDLVWGIYVERVSKARDGHAPDEEKIAAAVQRARVCLAALSDLMGPHPWLAGTAPTLADFHLAPMFDYCLKTTEGRELMSRHDNLEDWWRRMSARPSLAATAPA